MALRREAQGLACQVNIIAPRVLGSSGLVVRVGQRSNTLNVVHRNREFGTVEGVVFKTETRLFD